MGDLLIEDITDTAPGKAVAHRRKKEMQDPNQRLLEKVLDSGNIEVLERFIALRREEESRQAKSEFDRHFAAMQRELPIIYRDKTAEKDGKTLYDFASLDAILPQTHPIITRHGFSYSWDEESILDGKEKRVWCIVSGYGHDKKTFVDIPIMDATSFSNKVQQRGTATSYGNRYSFKNAFGIIIANQDNDAQVESTYKDYQIAIELTESMEELTKVYREAYAKMRGDRDALFSLCKWKDAQAAILKSKHAEREL